MTPPVPYHGPERRKMNAFEREVIEFMIRTDQRNMDRDLAHAVQDEVAIKTEERVCSLEKTRDTAVLIFKGTVAGVPALGSIAWACFRLGQFFKDFK